MKTVLLSQKIRDEGLEVLQGKADILVAPDPSQETIARLIKDVHGVILRTTSKITREMIESAPQLEVISRTGVGVDNVDVQAASERGIRVCNLPGLNSVSVAEHAAALIVAVTKALPFLDREVRQANWKSRNAYRPVELQHKTLGVIGFGKIGSYVAQIMQQGFGMNLLAYDPYVSSAGEADLNVTFCELDDLLLQADIVTIHLPATPETQNLVHKERLALLKPSAYFINTARGGVVDEAALVELLQAQRIAGAGLDVFEQEPLPREHPLTKLDNVILSPHAGALSKECVIRVAVEAAQAVLDVFAGREPKYVYNQAELNR
ncbi:hydroxyacid dehydrogenase [candidate division KSB3 bacterium]|jgi:D-3-phosphoglycerate dehydrogenase|uniref:Hydroxyacid dehydrogenase n=1 Tax=candidate division KSB3 bacterium TaxID=2044937 RepID=A0A9D5JVN6_9BACT|nr:hydroxyacid dehydrogenase [candidate division KSB3 bacterium]MBD3324993.1 hydroxyacid dehydrogenase [candidate division KSB3 bacterium]